MFWTIFKKFCVSCSKIFLCAENNPVVLKNSTGHAEPLFIALIENKNSDSDLLRKLFRFVLFSLYPVHL